MSTIQMSLRLGGRIPPQEKLTQILGIAPTKARRRGERISSKRVQPADIWILDLAKFDTDSTPQEIDKHMLQSAVIIQQLAPGLAALDRTNCNTDLYVSTVREEDQGGLSFSPELVAAAAAAKLSIQISILVMLDDYD
ncbi:MAG: DUF4279 domain-containing protein [Hormoscilla sp.]